MSTARTEHGTVVSVMKRALAELKYSSDSGFNVYLKHAIIQASRDCPHETSVQVFVETRAKLPGMYTQWGWPTDILPDGRLLSALDVDAIGRGELGVAAAISRHEATMQNFDDEAQDTALHQLQLNYRQARLAVLREAVKSASPVQPSEVAAYRNLAMPGLGRGQKLYTTDLHKIFGIMRRNQCSHNVPQLLAYAERVYPPPGHSVPGSQPSMQTTMTNQAATPTGNVPTC